MTGEIEGSEKQDYRSKKRGLRKQLRLNLYEGARNRGPKRGVSLCRGTDKMIMNNLGPKM